MNLEEFRKLPLLKEGESKEIRILSDKEVMIWLKPTIYSFTNNRCAWVEGSNLLRARCMKTLVKVMKDFGIHHAYKEIDDSTGLILAERVYPDNDPNIEVIVKMYNGGTSYHRYYNLHEKSSRPNHPYWPGVKVDKYEPYGGVKVRFDWRNPFWNPEKVESVRRAYHSLPREVYKWPESVRKEIMMRDEVLGEDYANDFIDVKKARRTALRTYACLQNFLAEKNIVIYDMCLFITSDGETVFGEINQDCGRFRHLDHGSLDKDVWRSGGSAGDVLEKWKLLNDMIES